MNPLPANEEDIRIVKSLIRDISERVRSLEIRFESLEREAQERKQ